MITTKFYLDSRRAKSKESAVPLKIAITKNGKTALISLNVSLTSTQWDKRANKVINHPQKHQLNTFVTQRKIEIDNILYSLINSGACANLSICEIKHKVLSILNPDKYADKRVYFAYRFQQFIDKKSGRTKVIYEGTLRHIEKFVGKSLPSLKFDNITKDWLVAFDAYLAKTSPSPNARNIHFRNIRAVFNDAIDNDITTFYPFRKFKFKPEPTRKRSFSVEQLRKIATAPLEKWQELYRDYFMLSFYLIGINVIDLCNLTEIKDGRVSYIRAKTNKRYSIKVEPEALKLIEKYKGKSHLLYIMDHYKNYRTFYTRICNGLSSIKDSLNKIDDGIVIKELTTYWARHSWATIAASLDIPKETIAEALGHDMGNPTTAIYIDFDHPKVDVANRKVIDWVLYNK